MRYRRLGSTEWMVSEVGLAMRALEGLDEAAAGATLGAALAQGITLLLVDAREHEGGVEAIIGRVTASERPRLVVVSRIERPAPDSTLEAQLRAAAARVSDDGYLDVALFNHVPDAGQRAVLDALAESRTVRAWGVETDDEATIAAAVASGAQVIVSSEAVGEAALGVASSGGAGVIIDAGAGTPGARLDDSRVASVVAEASNAAAVGALGVGAVRW